MYCVRNKTTGIQVPVNCAMAYVKMHIPLCTMVNTFALCDISPSSWTLRVFTIITGTRTGHVRMIVRVFPNMYGARSGMYGARTCTVR